MVKRIRYLLLFALFFVFFPDAFLQRDIFLEKRKNKKKEKYLSYDYFYNITTGNTTFLTRKIIDANDSTLMISAFKDTIKLPFSEIQIIERYWIEDGVWIRYVFVFAIGFTSAVLIYPIIMLADGKFSPEYYGIAGGSAASWITLLISSERKKFDVKNKWEFMLQ